MEKNNDRVSQNVSAVMFQSGLCILRNLFPEGLFDLLSKMCGFITTIFSILDFAGSSNRKTRKPETLSHIIRTQIQSLLSQTKNRKSHYVFCIRPNDTELASSFEIPFVQHQIHYMSMMPVVKMWRMGYCFHLSHMNFFTRYKMLHNDTWPFYYKGNIIEGIAKIIHGLPLPSAEFVLGSNSVFLRSPRTVLELEEIRRGRLNYLIIIIQSKFRSYVKRKKFLKLKRSQLIISRSWKVWRVRYL